MTDKLVSLESLQYGYGILPPKVLPLVSLLSFVTNFVIILIKIKYFLPFYSRIQSSPDFILTKDGGTTFVLRIP